MTEAQFKKLVPGTTVWSLTRRKAGNTTINTVARFPIIIKEINVEKQTVVASHNGNPPTTCYKGQWKSWKLQKPKLFQIRTGISRLATKEEIQAGTFH